MVFMSSCSAVKYHAELLNYIDIPVLDIHGKQKQAKRTSTFNEFVKAEVRALCMQRMCMRSKAWLAACVSLRIARLPPLQAGCGVRVAYAPRLRLRQAFSRMLWSQNSRS